MAGIVRQSKFRHVYCKPVKHESCISDVRITEITWDSLFCAVNPKFLAVINKGAGGPFQVIPLNKIGRIDKDYPFVDAHRAPCLEVAWSPFNDNVIASCSEDKSAKVWVIPERGLNRTINEPAVELVGHEKRVNTLAWHPTAQNILLTAGGENRLLLWNVGTGEALLEVAGHPDHIFSVAWNYDGSQFVTTCKDRKIRIIDSHSGDVLKEGLGPDSVKPQRAIFLKDGRVFTTGSSKRSERMWALRDPDDLSNPIASDELDTSNAVLYPLYDEDSGLMYITGKGDSNIRYFEINNEAPFVHFINVYSTSEPQRGLAFMPKRGVNSNENEMNRIYKVTTKGIVDVLQFFVPRKSDLYQADLYPDTRSTVPALTAEQFAEGQNAPPNLMAVNPEAAAVKPRIQIAKKANILASLPVQAPTAVSQPPQPSPARSEASDQLRSSPTLSETSDRRYTPSVPSSTPQRSPRIDDDMGIVRIERSERPASSASRQSVVSSRQEEAPTNPMVPKSSVQLRSRAERDDGGPMTSGQRRAAAELERIKRDQARTAIDDSAPECDYGGPNVRMSVAIPDSENALGAIFETLEKMKAVVRSQERRIRILEETIADARMANTWGL
uniref:Coronin n=1 Tax=Panagrellus redivivus TaxID=6233 RepID=A0A7E4VYK5_PANRE